MQNITEITTKGAGFDHAHANNNSQFSSRSSPRLSEPLSSLIQQKANSYSEAIVLNKGRPRLQFTRKIVLQPKRKLMKQLKKL